MRKGVLLLLEGNYNREFEALWEDVMVLRVSQKLAKERRNSHGDMSQRYSIRPHEIENSELLYGSGL